MSGANVRLAFPLLPGPNSWKGTKVSAADGFRAHLERRSQHEGWVVLSCLPAGLSLPSAPDAAYQMAHSFFTSQALSPPIVSVPSTPQPSDRPCHSSRKRPAKSLLRTSQASYLPARPNPEENQHHPPPSITIRCETVSR